MKLTTLALPMVCLLLTTACSKDDKADSKVQLPDRSEVQYAGAVAFELGTIDGVPKLFSDDKRQAHGQVVLCVKKNETQSGVFTITYSDFDVYGETDTGWDTVERKRVNVIKNSVDLEYKMNGWLEDSVIGGYSGKMNVETQVINISWRLINEDGSLGDIADPDRYELSNSHYIGDVPRQEDFEVKLSPNNILHFGTRSYGYQGQNYYISDRLMYTVVNEEHGAKLITDCEDQDEDYIIQQP